MIRLIHLRCLLVLLLVAVPASAEWKEKVLYSFQGGSSDGSVPAGGVVFDPQGNLYGATTDGGSETSCTPIGGACGTVFELSPPTQKGGPWTETLIYRFLGEGSKDASVPTSGLIIDSAGNLYGVTGYGGTGGCVLVGIKAGCGTVYEISPPQRQGGAWTETILYSFQGGNDGYFPSGKLVFDAKGDLYGATQFGGGKGTTCNIIYGGQCGTVFKVSPPKQKGGAWTENVLHSFTGISSGKQTGDGAEPNGGLVLGSRGAIYGTSQIGGNLQCPYSQGAGCGTAFRLTPPSAKGGAWKESVLHRFNRSSSDGGYPSAGLVVDAKGRLYGTTLDGGPGDGGIVFCLSLSSKKATTWTETILHDFNGIEEGLNPESPVVFDSKGNLYGTTYSGNTFSGTVFRLKPPARRGGRWTFAILYGFTGSPDGAQPSAGLIFDQYGRMYSTTELGGTGTCTFGCGTVFEVSP